jgi:hypothetical protein
LLPHDPNKIRLLDGAHGGLWDPEYFLSEAMSNKQQEPFIMVSNF